METVDEKMGSILRARATVAVVGASPNPKRPSHAVMRYLIEHGFNVIPVRPRVSEILDQRCFGSLEEIPVPVDIVDVFRKAEACPEVARSAVAIGARVLWLQEGIVSEDAAEIARQGGLDVVMDRCTMREHLRINR
ncbi:MAG: CoA-binding protein [Thermoleophilia bacterium]|nr:CoA-binding protein [Thermoleophilia bacterium]